MTSSRYPRRRRRYLPQHYPQDSGSEFLLHQLSHHHHHHHHHHHEPLHHLQPTVMPHTQASRHEAEGTYSDHTAEETD